MSLPPILPPIQYALLYSVGAASLLFVLLRTIRDMNLKANDMPKFILIRPGMSSLYGIISLNVMWVLTSFYIFLFLACYQERCVHFERVIWTVGFIGCLYASASILKLFIEGNFKSYFMNRDQL